MSDILTDAKRLLRTLNAVTEGCVNDPAVELKLLLKGYISDQERPSGQFCPCGNPVEYVNGERQHYCGRCGLFEGALRGRA